MENPCVLSSIARRAKYNWIVLFFASILQNQEESSGYTKEYLLVIDDPVSSFDIENKTGIMSFLRYQLGKFLLGNKDTRAIIMTHDLPTYYDSEKYSKN